MDNISPTIQNLYHKYSRQFPQLNMLPNVLDHIVKQTLETTYLIIDGLDESPNRQLPLDGMQQLFQTPDYTDSLKISVLKPTRISYMAGCVNLSLFFNWALAHRA